MKIKAKTATGTSNGYAATAVIVEIEGENFIATFNSADDAAAVMLAVEEMKNIEEGDEYYIFIGVDDSLGGVIFLTYTDNAGDEVKRRFELEKKYSVQIAQKLFGDIEAYIKEKFNG